MRTVWSGEMVTHRGPFFDFGPLQMTPAPSEPPPILVGGLSEKALRRAATVGDGWIGTGQTPEQAQGLLGRLAALRREAGRDREPFEAIVPLAVPPDPAVLRDLEAQGMTGTTVWPFSYTIGPSSTLDQKRDAMRRFADEVIAKVG
jgi:alkanesulfonate monooxygenase SsuD/methylene tetrahydromethanopterin reductase-like flavin-dependent oxidoreductase (luciferase family)